MFHYLELWLCSCRHFLRESLLLKTKKESARCFMNNNCWSFKAAYFCSWTIRVSAWCVLAVAWAHKQLPSTTTLGRLSQGCLKAVSSSQPARRLASQLAKQLASQLASQLAGQLASQLASHLASQLSNYISSWLASQLAFQRASQLAS